MTAETSLAVKVTEFWSNVDKRGADDCWPWGGYLEDGYGRYFYGGQMRAAHELAVTFTTGETRAKELDTCHSCNNPPCCNPKHLRFDTRASNVADMIDAGRQRRGRFTELEVVTMRTRYQAGARQTDIARDYGVTNGLISQIVRGMRYATIGGPIQGTRERYNKNGK